MDTNIKILIVEDERGINDIERKYLMKEGYQVEQAFDGEQAMKMLSSEHWDLVILDLMLPKISGWQIMERLRAEADTAVIMVTAMVEEDDVIKGLRVGADDYMTKPFSPREMVQRVKTVLRRAQENNRIKADILSLFDGRFVVDFDNQTVFKDNKEVRLTTNEYKIVQTLFSNPKKIFTREEIIELAFGLDYDAFDRAIDTHIKNIRHKLEDDPKNPILIKTVYGMGYKAGLTREI